ncbi:MAG: D-amino-acid transaminase [Bacillota bacterium]
MEGLGLINGNLVGLDEYVVPIEDRGHQLGDGVYEVTLVYGGKPFLVIDHMERMFRSASLLRIDIPYTLEELVKFHLLLIEKTGFKEALIYSQFTRGIAPRTHAFPEGIKPRLAMTIRPWTKINPALKENGAAAILLPDERWLKCNIKSLNLLGNVLVKQTALENGCFDGIMHRDGIVTEGANSNVFVVKGGEIFTHPANNKILSGITRATIIQFASQLNLKVNEEPFTTEFLMNADEVFLTGTTTEVMPIVKVSDQPIGIGKVGMITKKLHDLYQEKIIKECRS